MSLYALSDENLQAQPRPRRLGTGAKVIVAQQTRKKPYLPPRMNNPAGCKQPETTMRSKLLICQNLKIPKLLFMSQVRRCNGSRLANFTRCKRKTGYRAAEFTTAGALHSSARFLCNSPATRALLVRQQHASIMIGLLLTTNAGAINFAGIV